MKKICLLFVVVVLGSNCNNNMRPKEVPGIKICTELLPSDTLMFKGGILTAYRWRWPAGKKREIRVSFVDGVPNIQNRIKSIASQWEGIINATLVYVPNNQNPDIKISFAEKGASWSRIGTDSRNHNPSMNFGWLEEENVDSLFESVVLHEFGHALAMVHEHQLPNGNPIQWNRAKVYKYYMGYPNYWKTQEVDDNIFYKYSKNQITGGQFDPLSIMLYYIPDSLTTNGYSTPINVRISNEDRNVVSRAYKNN